MKIKRHSILFIVVAAFIILSCTEKKQIAKIDITKTYTLDIKQSSASWDRNLELGPTTTTMRLFGATTQVTIDGLKTNTNGTVIISNGNLTKFNDTIINGKVIFDFSTFKINTDRQEKGDDLLKVDQYPESTLEIRKFEKDSSDYLIHSNLTIANTTKEIISKAQITQNNDSLVAITTNILINTLEWPFRDEEAKKSVISDIITFNLDLKFIFEQTESDTTYIE